jgi:protein-S-isoprenylcysteine O-methyltransferase Ste14
MASAAERSEMAKRLDRDRLVRFLIAVPIYFGLFMFLPAGTLAWVRGWVFIAMFIGSLAIVGVLLWRVNPEVVVARTGVQTGTKPWDKVLLCFLLPAFYAIIPVAALDDGRFHWFPLSWWVSAVGYVLFFAGLALVARAEAVNKHFEVTVRIQTDRGHTVVDTGPYRVVRHPGYVAGIIFSIGAALALGSLWALVPAGIASALLILRTRWEDQMLQAELPGYREYAERVRYRLLPGVW